MVTRRRPRAHRLGDALRRTAAMSLALACAACGDGPAPPEAAVAAPRRPAPPTDTAHADPPGDPSPPAATGNDQDRRPRTQDQELHETYATILTDVVTATGLVRYARLAGPQRRAALDRVVSGYARSPLPVDSDTRLALWCNAYNANVLAHALRASEGPGFTSVVNVPGFFDRERITVAGESLTLNDLENLRIRPLGDPRIHAALVCAAQSCPPLRNEPFVADRLDEQLTDQCQRWINDPVRFRVDGEGIHVSSILQWYAEDFRIPPYGAELGFVLAFARQDGPLGAYIVNSESPAVHWLPYDWALNLAN